MNPYANKWHLAILGALIRRTNGPERNPERASRIRVRFAAVVTWAKSVDAEGVPLKGSFWIRLASGKVWQVQWMEQSGKTIRVWLPGSKEAELHTLEGFLKNFYPESLPTVARSIESPRCSACDGDVTFPHSHE